jgi:hypothetical protein
MTIKIDRRKPDIVLYQTSEEVAEPPILIKRYRETIELSQEGQDILLDPGTIPDLIKALNSIKAKPK